MTTKGALVFLDIDLDDSRAAYKRACDFVETSSIKYGLSSNILSELGGREKLSIPELYANDYHWSGKGRCQTSPQPATRLIFELFHDDSPLACENFTALCTGEKGKSKVSGLPLSYKGCKLHRYVPGFVLQGGDITFGNGTGGESIWGKKFKDDGKGLKLKHDARGILSMGNSGKHSNSSQFFITLAPAPKCNGNHVVMGRLKHGVEVLDLIDDTLAAALPERRPDEVPAVDIVVTACGLWNEGEAKQGYWDADDTFRLFQT
jgi:peptidylprolyl isomerase